MPLDFTPRVNHHNSASVGHGWLETLVQPSFASSPVPLEAQKVQLLWETLHFALDAGLPFPIEAQKVQPL
jgi:hypothetical protein